MPPVVRIWVSAFRARVVRTIRIRNVSTNDGTRVGRGYDDVANIEDTSELLAGAVTAFVDEEKNEWKVTKWKWVSDMRDVIVVGTSLAFA